MAAILVLGVKVPFTSGGQEVLVKSLVRELKSQGHRVDTVEMPFSLPDKYALLSEAARWRSMSLEEFGGISVDLVIATKFPSYYVSHPRKSLWLVHQHRPLYDLFGSNFSDFSTEPRDEALRKMMFDADTKALNECQVITTISQTVADRLKSYNNVVGTPLWPPLPLGRRYYSSGERKPYILSVGRICGIKRVDLMVKALPKVHEFVSLKVVGEPDESGVMDYLRNEVAKHHLDHRVEFLGRVSDDLLLELYGGATAVYYAPYQEDYGFVTLEAFASGTPVVTATDSGGTLEFVKDGETGVIVSPTTESIAHGCNRIISDDNFAKKLGEAGKRLIDKLGLAEGWDNVIKTLLAPTFNFKDLEN
jgi:glycosyltransferase involved in cell wall biosynthesis